MIDLRDVLGTKEASEVEVLIPEARTRQRKRRLFVAISVFIIVIVGALIAALGNGGHGGNGSLRTIRKSVPPSSPSRTPQIAHQSAVSVSSGFPEVMLSVGIVNGITWASNCQGYYLSRDRGKTWTNITPSTIGNGLTSVCNEGGPIFSNTAGVLLMEVSGVPGLGFPGAPGNGGSPRGGRLEVSYNDGASRTITQPPGCYPRGCGVFGALANGDLYELAPNDDLYESSPTATNWTLQRTVQSLGQNQATGQAEFDGFSNLWETSYPGSGSGQKLFHSDDEGTSWARTDPGGATRYQLPTLFGSSTAVMLGYDPSKSEIRGITVYTTSNDGHSWSRHPLPKVLPIEPYVPFFPYAPVLSATSPSDWHVADGNGLYSTSDAGRTWTLISKGLPWSYNGVGVMTFASNNFGYVIPANSTESTNALWVTSDGGKRWNAVNNVNKYP